jgi:hypothetical protein
MSPEQEDALYEFLDNVTEPFTLDNVASFVKMMSPRRASHLAREIRDYLDSRNAAFKKGDDQWVSRRGFFEPLRFVISPTRLELQNGILIPGHRCVPFANPLLLSGEYTFFWKGSRVPWGTTEGAPEDFYPYYAVLGEEYASQYVAQDNLENEKAYNSDPYEDPPEVSVQTLDMRNIYRETAFVPGDRFVLKTRNWKSGAFELTRVEKDAWPAEAIDKWCAAAEAGFAASFERLGPGSSTEEQIAYAYWYGGRRMRELPAAALEEFLYERTDNIDTAPYGIESRFWYAGREIPDRENLEGGLSRTERTAVEDILFRSGVPISEYVIQSYVRDALFRNEQDVVLIMERLVPLPSGMSEKDKNALIDYVIRAYREFKPGYSLFADQRMGPVRQRVAELHTAVIDLVTRLRKGDIDASWLPQHTFVILSQIQGHAAAMLEDLDDIESPEDVEMEAMDNSLDNMIETYEDIKRLIDDSLDSFRRTNISVVKTTGRGGFVSLRTVQLSLQGTDVWRRIVMPASGSLEDLHRIIQVLFGWDGRLPHRFAAKPPLPAEGLSLEDLGARGEVLYEYGNIWSVKVMVLAAHEAEEGGGDGIRCVAGEMAAPPLFVEGPVRFRKLLAAGRGHEPAFTVYKRRGDFDPDAFDIDECNRHLKGILYGPGKTNS